MFINSPHDKIEGSYKCKVKHKPPCSMNKCASIAHSKTRNNGQVWTLKRYSITYLPRDNRADFKFQSGVILFLNTLPLTTHVQIPNRMWTLNICLDSWPPQGKINQHVLTNCILSLDHIPCMREFITVVLFLSITM